MQKQTIEFAVTRKNGIITRIGRTGISQPGTGFKGNPVRLHADSPKQSGR